jgi:TatA/E family protein of Tat protein translocase
LPYLDFQSLTSYDSIKTRFGVFGSGFEDIGFILFLAFLLFGPKKLPEIARVIGKGLGELRRARDEMRFSLEDEVRRLELDRDHLTEDFTRTLDVESYEHTAIEQEEAESTAVYGHHRQDPSDENP